MYRAEPDPYVYPGTSILKYLFGIRDCDKLAKLERRLTSARANEGLPKGRLDYAHYKSIHRHLFQDVYE
jgi:cell filamentation protein